MGMIDSLEPRVQVAKATEEVWAEAEAWVDAEAKAEDEAWARLQQHGDKLVVVVNGSNAEEVDMLLDVRPPLAHTRPR
jgi:hypothetical protein